MGGDKTLNPMLSIDNNPVTKPAFAQISFMTGTSDYTQTRQISSWLNNAFVTIQSQMYQSLYSLVPYNYNPWSQQVQLKGTDGL